MISQSSFLKPASSIRLHRCAILTAAATFLLLCAGALVTSTGSGLSVPDWPLSYGQFFPPMIGGILYEHGHRMIAGSVGILAIILTVWILMKEPRLWVRLLAVAAVVIVLIQALLGGLTVLYLLPHEISISHAALAEIFFCCVTSLALFTSPHWISMNEEIMFVRESKNSPFHISSFILSSLTMGIIYFQILLGALFRHAGIGIWIHAGWAAVVVLFVVWIAVRALKCFSKDPFVKGLVTALLMLCFVQLMLGPGAWVVKIITRENLQPSVLKVALTAAHLAVGALMLATSLLLTLWVYRYSPERESV